MAQAKEEWSPEKRAFAAQWLVQKNLDYLREKMPPAAFEELAQAINLLLSAWRSVAQEE
jgi:hypothetical protein